MVLAAALLVFQWQKYCSCQNIYVSMCMLNSSPGGAILPKCVESDAVLQINL